MAKPKPEYDSRTLYLLLRGLLRTQKGLVTRMTALDERFTVLEESLKSVGTATDAIVAYVVAINEQLKEALLTDGDASVRLARVDAVSTQLDALTSRLTASAETTPQSRPS